jgi:uncharacterized membrane protein (UPF0127 family)
MRVPSQASVRRGLIAAVLGGMLVLVGGCLGSGASTSGSGETQRQYALSTIPTVTVTIGTHPIRAWLAQEFDTQRPGIVQEGLMFVPAEDLEGDVGMLFVFRSERIRGFWMQNTITPLDIAFARMDGTIVKTWPMPALSLQSYSSIEPVMYALEMKQGSFARLGIQEGDRLVIPTAALLPAP